MFCVLEIKAQILQLLLAIYCTVLYCRYYTEDSDHEMEVWVVVGDTGPAAAKQLTLVVTPFKVSRAN